MKKDKGFALLSHILAPFTNLQAIVGSCFVDVNVIPQNISVFMKQKFWRNKVSFKIFLSALVRRVFWRTG